MEENPWLLYNEKIVDFIRWKELGYVIALFSISVLMFGWWGLLIAWVFDMLNHMAGGPVADAFDEYPLKEYPPNTCSAGVKDCQICLTTYIHDHDFNVKYEQSLKWWEKVL